MVRRSIGITVVVLALVGCTFGLGEYPVSGESATLPSEAAAQEDPGEPGEGDAAKASDGASDAAAATDGGPCNESDPPRACKAADGDAGECIGTQKCVLGKWGPCDVSRRCPSTWPDGNAQICRKTDVKGDSPADTGGKWVESPQQGAPQTWWNVSRALPFDTYGENDRFCFVPKQFGNCYTTSTTALEVVCTNSQMKLSGNDFADGSIHNKRYCVDRTGPNCVVVDKQHLVWSGGPVKCERWFESAAFVVEAAPRCAPW